jgi:DNA-binding beta-propeller fold protein YncE
LVFWSLSNLLLFSLAGERMPWLTVNMALPMILTTGWGIGYLLETSGWDIGSAWTQRFRSLQLADIRRAAVLICFAFLGVLTVRTAIRAAFIHSDSGLEFLVYAHSARGPKEVLAQIEAISYRITRAKDITVAYDNHTNYPYWWYLRDYPNKIYYGENPTRDLRNAAIVLVGEEQFGKLEPILGKEYFKIETSRLCWPMEDYSGLNWGRIANALSDPLMRNAIFEIWFNRNYQAYAELEQRSDLSLANWRPSQRMRMYIRKDIVAQMWDAGQDFASLPPQVDPYAAGKLTLAANIAVGSSGPVAGQFNAPRQIAFSADGSLYVADSRNHRIQHLSADGKTVIAQWGTFADISKGSAPGGTFYEPWGIAVGLDDSVYVADTWNNRIQKFSAEGQFISMWGVFGTGTRPDTFWGPRGLAVDPHGNLLVTDTGNKRIVVFDPDGKFVTQFGSAGSEAGQFDEPVAVAIDPGGRVYVTDTWNQRIQVLAPDPSGKVYTTLLTWEIDGWFGQSLENKPFIAADRLGYVFVTDPEGQRVLEFKTTGEFLHTWDSTGVATGISVDSQGNVWVSDATNMKLLRFSITP